MAFWAVYVVIWLDYIVKLLKILLYLISLFIQEGRVIIEGVLEGAYFIEPALIVHYYVLEGHFVSLGLVIFRRIRV